MGVACVYEVYTARLTVRDSLVFGGLPLVALALMIACLAVGPVRLRPMRHPKLVLNLALVVWTVASLIFWIAGAAIISSRT
jgi:hypothetical protein